jgi:hypothetical protein
MAVKTKKNMVRIKPLWAVTFSVWLVTLYCISLVTPILNGYAWFPIAHIKCGTQPYIASSFSAANSYVVPGDGNYHGPGIFTSPSDYYCTRAAVEATHYKANEWGERCRTNSQTNQTYCAKGGNGYVGLIPFVGLLAVGGAIGAYAHLKPASLLERKRLNSN